MKAKRTAKQIAAATKNILAYEKKDDYQNILMGFVLGAITVLLACMLSLGIIYSL